MNRDHQRGFALIAVLVALAILLAMLVPFLSGVLNEGSIVNSVVERERVDQYSEGLRDYVLHRGGQTHPAVEFSTDGGTPDWDSLDELEGLVTFPEAFKDPGIGRLQQIELQDVQRYIHLPSASPLVLGNLLGLATSLAEDFEVDSDTIVVLDGESFPEAGGSLLIRGERIDYSRRQGNVFRGIRRSLEQSLPEQSLVLDYRVVQAITWQFCEQFEGDRRKFEPFRSVEDVQRIAEVEGSAGAFTVEEMDILTSHCTAIGANDSTHEWGRPVRVFNDREVAVEGEPPYLLFTKTVLGLGAGAVVRISSLENPNKVEYNLVWATQAPPRGTIVPGLVTNLQNGRIVHLLFPPQQDFEGGLTVVQPLVPVAVNVNTAGRDVLVALLQNLRRGPVRDRTGNAQVDAADSSRQYGNQISHSMARELADELIELRGGGKPLQGWEDLTKRFFIPRGEEAFENDDRAGRSMLVMLLENMLYGRSPVAEMGTMPINFASNSLVRYRVGVMETLESGLETSRSELTGLASVVPGDSLDMLLISQRGWLENIRLDRRSPRWTTYPINVGPVDTGDLGTDPAEIASGMLFPDFYPEAGFGTARYPSPDRGQIRMAPAIAQRGGGFTNETFQFGQHADGRDLDEEGVFEMINTGPTSAGGERRAPRHPDASFGFTGAEGMPGRHTMSFWFKLENLSDQSVYDISASEADRNRINLRLEAGHLVLEVLDEAGLDPAPTQALTSPERTAGTWRVPYEDINLQPEVWYHANLSADGNRADQLSLFIDGFPRGNPEFVTYLTVEIPEFKRPVGDDPLADARYLSIPVESTEGFPPQGVLRIGRELFEYTSKDDGAFHCRPADSMGGRKARQTWTEFRESVDQILDEFGRPTKNAEDLEGSPSEDVTPASPAGSAVELYGYAASIYRNTPLTVGSTSLRDALGAFSIARASLDAPDPIRLQGTAQAFSPGDGMTETTTKDIVLVDPLPDEDGQGPRREVSPEIVAGFPPGGGYALLIQWYWNRVEGQGARIGQEPEPILNLGGIELIQYAQRSSNKLTGITRGVHVPDTDQFLRGGALYGQQGEARQFVTHWNAAMRDAGRTPYAELAQFGLYIVPVSLPVSDARSLNDPLESELTEWAQIYPGTGREQDTEWVRYNAITLDGQLIRAHDGPWRQLHRTLTSQLRLDARMLFSPLGGATTTGVSGFHPGYSTPQDDGLARIGYLDPIEVRWPVVHYARRALDFRGDSFSGTSSHGFSAGALVVPCHRLEMDWGRLGALSARIGRNDRVALVGGTQASGTSRPPVDWHTINWFAQRHGGDVFRNDGLPGSLPSAGGPERLGPYPFQMVAFKSGVNDLFIGPAARQDFLDTRRVDRVVKFPSGEMPAAYVEAAWLGGVNPTLGDYDSASGFLDDVSVVERFAETTLLNTGIDDSAMEIPVRMHTRLYSYGPLGVSTDLTRAYPQSGGLLLVDGEVIAYRSYDNGVFSVAEGGRGLLGTEPRAHADTARVQYLPHVPAAILQEPVSSLDHEFVVQSIGALPRFGGTVLLGQQNPEVVHYTWTDASGTALGMPEWFDPEDLQSRGTGLFRGRYGTVPQGATEGAALIWLPFRHWDRYHVRSDDPELAYYQATRRETPVYWSTVQWRDENPEPSLLGLRVTVNIDDAGSFADDPEKVLGMFLFEHGTIEDQPNRIDWQGSTIEFRFATEYKPGAFDSVSFLSNGWKQSITIQDVIVNYEGDTRILEERQTNR